MTFDQSFVLQELHQIEGYLDESKNFLRFSDKEILEDSEKMHVAERLLQLLADTAVDVNQHFIKELGLPASEDFQGTFYTLAENNILPQDFANKMAPVVGVRNRLVHRYESLNKKLFVENFRAHHTDFEKYTKLINDYLEKTDS